jgi:hypothetical protein
MYHAINLVGKEIMIPRNGDINYVPTFDNIQPTHDCYGRRLAPAFAQRFPFGAYDILVLRQANYVIYRNINRVSYILYL